MIPVPFKFSPWGEMFVSVADSLSVPATSTILRYIFDGIGNATPNGSFTTNSVGLHHLEFNSHGELFIPDNSSSLVYRFLFDENHQPISNGAVPVGPGANGVAFGPDGEMFVSHQSPTGLLRFLFDGQGNAIPNGQELAGNLLGEVSVFPFAPIPGDVNDDGIVNGQDISIIAGYWLHAGATPGDANNDGIVNGLDITLVSSHWLWTSPTGPGAATSVPEPSTIALAALGFVLLVFRRHLA